jgi:hypothetical protein
MENGFKCKRKMAEIARTYENIEHHGKHPQVSSF